MSNYDAIKELGTEMFMKQSLMKAAHAKGDLHDFMDKGLDLSAFCEELLEKYPDEFAAHIVAINGRTSFVRLLADSEFPYFSALAIYEITSLISQTILFMAGGIKNENCVTLLMTMYNLATDAMLEFVEKFADEVSKEQLKEFIFIIFGTGSFVCKLVMQYFPSLPAAKQFKEMAISYIGEKKFEEKTDMRPREIKQFMERLSDYAYKVMTN